MRPLTVEPALASAQEAGCTFRLTGADIEAVGISRVPNHIVAFLKHNRDAVYALLGGTAQDETYLALIESLGVEVVYCTADAAAAAAVDEVIADAGDRPIALDVETTPLPAYVVTKPLLLTVRGRPYKRQPRDKDRNASGLDPSARACVFCSSTAAAREQPSSTCSTSRGRCSSRFGHVRWSPTLRRSSSPSYSIAVSRPTRTAPSRLWGCCGAFGETSHKISPRHPASTSVSTSKKVIRHRTGAPQG